METFIWDLKITDAMTTSITSQVITVAFGVALLCFACNMGYNYIKNGFESFVSGGEGKFPDYMEIGRCVAIIIIISVYLPFIKVVVGTCEVINQATAVSSEVTRETQEISNTLDRSTAAWQDEMALDDDEQAQNENQGWASKMANWAKKRAKAAVAAGKEIAEYVSNGSSYDFLTYGLHALFGLLKNLIEFIVTGIAVVIVKVLVMLGPLAFAFSILPVFRKQIEIWFSTLVTTCMVFTTINILNAIFAAVFLAIKSGQAGFYTDLSDRAMGSDEVLALDCILVIMYCTSFWLTGKIVGKGDAGRIISKMVGTATALAGMAIGAAAAKGGGAALKNAASTGANAIEKAAQDGE